MSDAMDELRRLIQHYDFINEMRWGDDEKEPPTWDEVRNQHLSDWNEPNLSFEYWSAYMTSMIISYARDVSKPKP